MKGKLKELTVEELNKYLIKHGLSKQGKKADRVMKTIVTVRKILVLKNLEPVKLQMRRTLEITTTMKVFLLL